MVNEQQIQAEIDGGCCRTTDDGQAICHLPTAGQKNACSCQLNETIPNEKPIVSVGEASQDDRSLHLWRKIRSAVMFGVACVTSPCCTPLLVPVVLALLAGTPVAVWLAAHLGWVYGGLTVVSVLSLVVGWRWLKQKTTVKHRINLTDRIQTSPILEPERVWEILS